MTYCVCRVSKERIVKIADFGLARDMYEADYYRIKDSTRPLPIKWMAVEALKDLKFTTKSDVVGEACSMRDQCISI
jgi:hypothetical protein